MGSKLQRRMTMFVRLMASVAAVLASVLVASPHRQSAAQGSECITLADFAGNKVGEFPEDWRARKDEGKAVYSVRAEGGKRYLAAESHGLGIQAAKEREWDLGQYPVLAWAWRPREFPSGADERESATNDSVLAVYLLVPHSRIRGPKAVKYVWSEKVPVGTHLTSNVGLTQVRVLRSGTAGRGEWAEERVNVLEDYRKFFRESGTPKPAGIAVLTDSDDTKSSAAGDYANFRACRS
jgi:Protein of unknown function (DUF3047)